MCVVIVWLSGGVKHGKLFILFVYVLPTMFPRMIESAIGSQSTLQRGAQLVREAGGGPI